MDGHLTCEDGGFNQLYELVDLHEELYGDFQVSTAGAIVRMICSV